MKKIYLVRHCEAVGQQAVAPLTEEGKKQAGQLSKLLKQFPVERIISSPYIRAKESIKPFAIHLNEKIEIEERLTERILSKEPIADWMEKLRVTFVDDKLRLPGGESSKEARIRIIKVIEEIIESKEEHVVIVTHGNLLALLLQHFDKSYGFDEWKKLSNPDVFLLTVNGHHAVIERIWK